jgi:ABC-type sugar transport system ATPase subunit
MASISLQGVSKRFAGGVAALADLDLEIAHGELLVLVGPSGSGKSTVLRLIAGLDAPTSGHILIDGEDVTGVPPQQRDLAMVFQSYALYPHKTVRENLAFGLQMRRVETTRVDERVREVAKILGIDGLLERRPAALSGGQRQRVAIARAFLKDAPILVLDEATSHLDAVNEQAVRRALDLLQADRTTIVIAHRLSTVRDADLIVVLDAGRVAETGTHASLLARNGLYARLVSRQLASVYAPAAS